MNEIHKNYCLLISNNLKTHPTFKLLVNILSDVGLIEKKEFEGLNLIIKNLNEGNYTSISEFRRNISNLWKKSKKISEENFLIHQIGDFIENKFRKLWNLYFYSDISIWATRIIELEKKIHILTKNFPEKVNNEIPVELKGRLKLNPIKPKEFLLLFENKNLDRKSVV